MDQITETDNMDENASRQPGQSPVNHLHTLNLTVALLAGIISIVGGVLTLKANFFSAPKYGSIAGVVRDEAIAKPLWLSTVEVTDSGNLVVDSVKTGQDGAYLIKDLKEGDYTIKILAPLHEGQSKPVKVESGKTSSINIDLVPVKQQQTEIAVAAPSVPIRSYPQAVPSTPAQTSAQKQPAVASSSPYQPPSGTWRPDSAYNGYPPSSTYPPRHHRRFSSASDTSTSGDSSGSQQNALMQIGGQLLQQWSDSRSESQATSPSSSNS